MAKKTEPTMQELTARSFESLRTNLLHVAVDAARATKENPTADGQWAFQKLIVVEKTLDLLSMISYAEDGE